MLLLLLVSAHSLRQKPLSTVFVCSPATLSIRLTSIGHPRFFLLKHSRSACSLQLPCRHKIITPAANAPPISKACATFIFFSALSPSASSSSGDRFSSDASLALTNEEYSRLIKNPQVRSAPAPASLKNTFINHTNLVRHRDG